MAAETKTCKANVGNRTVWWFLRKRGLHGPIGELERDRQSGK